MVKTLLKDRTNTLFSLIWARILQGKPTEIQTIEDPKLPRKRKARVRHEIGEQDQDPHHFPETPKDHYKRIYFNAIDTVMQCVATRFNQEDFKIYVNIQECILTEVCVATRFKQEDFKIYVNIQSNLDYPDSSGPQ